MVIKQAELLSKAGQQRLCVSEIGTYVADDIGNGNAVTHTCWRRDASTSCFEWLGAIDRKAKMKKIKVIKLCRFIFFHLPVTLDTNDGKSLL